MQTVLLFGGTGNLGKKIAAELQSRNYNVTAVVRNEQKAAALHSLVKHTVVADVTNASALSGICAGFNIVISALGKSVSPADRSKASFEDIDLHANSLILDEAVRGGVSKFVYVSALGAENYPHLVYFRTHHEFSERLNQSGIDYTIVKPPALFSAFVDLIDMAKKGRLVNMGSGKRHTNPIAEADLAKVTVDAINRSNAVIEAGGPEVLTRRQINEIIQNAVAPQKKVRTVPMGIVTASLPAVRIFSKNIYDKLAFFTAVMQHDVVAPRLGTTRLADYVRDRVQRADT